MKHILSLQKLSESTSAYSQERAGWDYNPFKFAKNYDPRVGYSKLDFLKDITDIYRKFNKTKRRSLMDVVYKSAGILRLRMIADLPNDKVDILMKDVERFLETKADHQMLVLPDGFILCYERIKKSDTICDIYYSPYKKYVRIVYTDYYPETTEKYKKLEDFNPVVYGIKKDEFKAIIDKCDSYLNKNSQNLDKYLL